MAKAANRTFTFNFPSAADLVTRSTSRKASAALMAQAFTIGASLFDAMKAVEDGDADAIEDAGLIMLFGAETFLRMNGNFHNVNRDERYTTVGLALSYDDGEDRTVFFDGEAN